MLHADIFLRDGKVLHNRIKESYVQLHHPDIHRNVINVHGEFPFVEKLYLYLNQMERPKCKGCGGDVKYKKFGTGFSDFCSRKCMHESGLVLKKIQDTNLNRYGTKSPLSNKGIRDKIKNTVKANYGVDNIGSAKSVQNKIKTTNKKKLGVDYPLQSPSIRAMAKNTLIENSGVDNPMKKSEVVKSVVDKINERYGGMGMSSDIIKNKAADTNTVRYGSPNPWGSDQVRDKSKNTNIRLFGCMYPIQNDEIKGKMRSTLMSKTIDIVNGYDGLTFVSVDNDGNLIVKSKCNHEFKTSINLIYHRNKHKVEQCTECNKIGGRSGKEDVICEILSGYGIEYERNNRTILNGKEIDIFVPSLGLGFEVNGIFWHSAKFKNKLYHQDKKINAHQAGVNLITIWEDDLINKKQIITSRISSLLGKNIRRVYARKCRVSVIDKRVAKDFFVLNHLQGYANSASHNYGLFDGDRLVAAMSFGKLRNALGRNSKTGSFELLRFCSEVNTTVVGGANKLLNYFIKETRPDYIMSYADLCWTELEGSVYDKLGMQNTGITRPGYYYVNKGKREFRYKYRKSELVKLGFDRNKTEFEITDEMGLLRIFDCGNLRYEMFLTTGR